MDEVGVGFSDPPSIASDIGGGLWGHSEHQSQVAVPGCRSFETVVFEK